MSAVSLPYDPAESYARARAMFPYRATLEDFWMFAQTHDYIYVHDGAHWPAASVNAKVPPVEDGVHEDGPKKGKPKYLPAAQWIDRNRVVEQKTWYPGLPQIVAGRLMVRGEWVEHRGAKVFNLYRAPTQRLGDAASAGMWLDLMASLYPDDYKELILWFAHRVQRPGEKVNHAIVLGGAPGIGKDSVLEPVTHAVGPWNVANIRPVDTLSDFNPFVKSVLVRINEVRDLGEMDRRAFYEHMKTYICAPPAVHTCNEKHLRQYEVPNVCGVVMTTNYPDALYLTADDRRHFVAWSEAKQGHKPKEFWDEYYAWLEAEGHGHVAAYLGSLDLGSFNPKGSPRHTAGFETMRGASTPSEDSDIADALDDLGVPEVDDQGVTTIKHPEALVVADLKSVGNPALVAFLDDPRTGPRAIASRLTSAGYRAEKNRDNKSGRWSVPGIKNKVTIYVKMDLVSERERQDAAARYQKSRNGSQGSL